MCETVVEVRGELNMAALREAWVALVDRHEILRTTFRFGEMVEPLQVIEDARGVALLDGGPLHESDDVMSAVSSKAARTRLDLASGVPVLGRVFRVEPTVHRLSITLPSLCSDRQSLRNMVTDLAVGYGTRVGGPAPSPPPMQYADFAAWANSLIDAEDASAARNFWKRAAASASPSPLLLPFERPHSHSDPPAAESLRIEFGEEIRRRLEGLDEVAWDRSMLASWWILLSRIVGRSDFNIGVGFAGRAFEEIKSMSGPCARFLPFGGANLRGITFAQFARSIERRYREAEKWQDLFDWDLAFGPNGHAESIFYPITFEAFDEPLPIEAGGCSFSIEGEIVESEGSGLTLVCVRTIRGLKCDLFYLSERFDREDVKRIAAQFETVVYGAAASPDARIEEIPWLPDRQRRQLLGEFNQTTRPISEAGPYYRRFEAQAVANPDSIAVVCRGDRLSYAELNARANRLAHRLRDHGVGSETSVGIFLARSVESLVAMLAVSKAGGAFVPLDPSLPHQRIVRMTDRVRLRVAISLETAREGLPADIPLILLDRDAIGIASESSENLTVEARPEQLAYVLFTSGSTGTPKGVGIEHRQLANYIDGILERLAPPPASSFAMVSTFSADLANTMIFPSLVTGGVLHIVTEDLASNPDVLAASFATEGVDYLKIVPSHLAALLSAPRPQGVIPRRALVLGGEMLPWKIVDRIRELAPECEIVNHYGPTETTVGVTTYRLPRGGRDSRCVSVPVGRPLANTRVYVLDEERCPVPIWSPGELYIGGAGVARGYVEQPDRTAERFVVDPFTDGARLYRTGDLARFLPDGNLEILGRTDDQVKIHGFRIEPGEVSSALLTHPAIRESVVLARETRSESKRLVAYLASRGAAKPSSADLRSFLLERLPEFMVPADYVWLEALPLNSNGKLDRLALLAMEVPDRDSADRFVAPRSPREQVMSRVWAEVLRLERVGIYDNFFEIGGDSILAIQIIARALREGLRLTPRQLFEHQTVAELAEVAESEHRIAEPVDIGVQEGTVRPAAPDFSKANLSAKDLNTLLSQIESARKEPG